ncbi:protein of unknown function [Candidatus Filomicrobium marinum]|uniref:Uncharacterized protein n=1 Tax=Candidatus Filomicrobium marinum TaxID=1608628 RepID=A0A0D6JGW4_9HYPH|nr:protein of unknown function [Candidatus Filomicrobium marinum]CPR20403.1 protein of unknown function [Candidatus Filomicrobium marinum]
MRTPVDHSDPTMDKADAGPANPLASNALDPAHSATVQPWWTLIGVCGPNVAWTPHSGDTDTVKESQTNFLQSNPAPWITRGTGGYAAKN